MEYLRIFTLRDGREKTMKIEPWRSFNKEMNVLGITRFRSVPSSTSGI